MENARDQSLLRNISSRPLRVVLTFTRLRCNKLCCKAYKVSGIDLMVSPVRLSQSILATTLHNDYTDQHCMMDFRVVEKQLSISKIRPTFHTLLLLIS